MAIITEEPDPQETKLKQSPRKPNQSRKPVSPNPGVTANPFVFWFYFTLSVTAITLILVSLSSFTTPDDPKSWFLSLPDSLRQHYSKGRTIKVQTSPNRSPIEVFIIGNGAVSSENVVLVHGLGLSSYSFRQVIQTLGSKGVHAVAIDLPGSGFSDKSTVEIEEGPGGTLGRFWDVYGEIKEKGLFWAFDQIIETGQIPYQEIGNRVSKREVVKALDLSPEEMGKLLGQVIETMGLSPVHLVLHDSALGLGASWISENSAAVRSVTLVDTAPKTVAALPLWVLEVPVLRDLLLGVSFAFTKLINSCCSKRMEVWDAVGHRILLSGRDGRRAVVGMGKKLNYSFDLAEWGASDVLKGIPIQVLWSDSWSEEWSKEGRHVAKALPQANFVTHSGGRWPQEDAADELAENIVLFISSLPKTVRQLEEEPLPEHLQKMLDEAKSSDHHHHHHAGHGHRDHGHVHATGYMDAYGLGHGWGS